MPININKDSALNLKMSRSSIHRQSTSGLRLYGLVFLIFLIVLVLIAGAIFQIVRSPGKLKVSLTNSKNLVSSSSTPLMLPWPPQGEAALEIQGIGLLGSYGGNTAYPLWSVTKLMTAYVIYKDHPLSVGQQGPTITVTPADVAVYNQEVAQHDSVVKIAAGEQMSELVALQALLVPSGDNIATMLANWDAGSVQNFTVKMNFWAQKLGMINTHYADASGLNTQSVSTASDQLKLLKAVWTIPILSQILEMPQVVLPPPSGLQYNYDYLTGYDGFLGGKTGSVTTGTFAFVAQKQILGQLRTIFGVILDQSPYTQAPFALSPKCNTPNAPICIALGAAYNLVNAIPSINFSQLTIPAGTALGWVTSPWGQSSKIVTTSSLTFITFPGISYSLKINQLKTNLTNLSKNQILGLVTFYIGTQKQSVKLAASSQISSPSIFWKLTRV
jgi:D-alanyl-D-alanine carboxypeptidase (penicillin-binding protein 5/6)